VARLLKLSPEHRVVEVIPENETGPDETAALLWESMSLQRDEDLWGMLCDFTEAVTHLTLPEVIALADMLPSAGLPPVWRQAILRPHDVNSAVSVDLWCAAANNRGFQVAVFRDRGEALAWLDEAHDETTD
jgi:hypothetical protein